MDKRLIAALTVLVLAVAGIGAAVVARSGSNDATAGQSSSPSASGSATVPVTVKPGNLLVTLFDDDKKLTVASVQGVTAARIPVGALAVPPALAVNLDSRAKVVELAGYSSSEIGAATDQVSNQLGISFVGGWALERVAFAALVDNVGGVTVGESEELLTGSAAAEYVLGSGPKVKSATKNARFAAVWASLLTKLSDDADRLRSILTSLGATAQRSVSVNELAEQLRNLKQVAQENGIRQESLATRSTGSGTLKSESLVPNESEPTLVSLYPRTQLFPGRNGAKPRVRFQLAGASSESALASKDKISEAGFVFVWGGSLAAKNQSAKSKTRIYVASEAVAATVGRPLARAFDVPQQQIRVDRDRAVGVQALVVAS